MWQKPPSSIPAISKNSKEVRPEIQAFLSYMREFQDEPHFSSSVEFN